MPYAQPIPYSEDVSSERNEELRLMAQATWSNPDLCDSTASKLTEGEAAIYKAVCLVSTDVEARAFEIDVAASAKWLKVRDAAARRKAESDAEARGHVATRILDYQQLSTLPKPTPLIWNVAYTGSVGVMLADSQQGKTWVMLSVAASAASGLHWPVWRQYPKPAPMPVLYVAAEDGGSIGARLAMWEKAKNENLSERTFHAHPSAINVLDVVQIEELCEAIKERGYRFIVIDTIAASLGGEDEGNAEFSRLVKHMRMLVTAMDGQGSVFLVHHFGKDRSKGARGGSALYNDVDIVWELDGMSLDDITMKCTKWKSDSLRKPWSLKLDRTEGALHITANDQTGSVSIGYTEQLDKVLTDNILKIISERCKENQGFGPSGNVILESLRHKGVKFRTADLKPRLDYLVAEREICSQTGKRGATLYRPAPVQESVLDGVS